MSMKKQNFQCGQPINIKKKILCPVSCIVKFNKTIIVVVFVHILACRPYGPHEGPIGLSWDKQAQRHTLRLLDNFEGTFFVLEIFSETGYNLSRF